MDTLVVLSKQNNSAEKEALGHIRAFAERFPIQNLIIGYSLDELGIAEGKEGPAKSSSVVVWMPSVPADTLNDVAATMPNLKLVHSWIAGVNQLHNFMRDRRFDHVALTNARQAFSSSLAEYVMMATMYFTKEVQRLQRNREEKRWDKFIMNTISGKTMGFVGYGHIAQTTARLAKAFGMKIIALRRQKRDCSRPVEVEPDETFYCDDENRRGEVFRRSDFIVCSLPGTPQTVKFIGVKEFAMMKPSAVFISAGRGTVVDEAALIEVLKTKSILGAALDVFVEEPLPQSSELWSLSSVLISSHNADVVKTYHQDACRVMEENLKRLIEGKELFSPVDKSHGY